MLSMFSIPKMSYKIIILEIKYNDLFARFREKEKNYSLNKLSTLAIESKESRLISTDKSTVTLFSARFLRRSIRELALSLKSLTRLFMILYSYILLNKQSIKKKKIEI